MVETIGQWIKKSVASRNFPEDNIAVDREPEKGTMFTIGLLIQNYNSGGLLCLMKIKTLKK